MTAQLTATAVLFQDDFSTNGPLNSSNWDYNHYTEDNNSSHLGATQMRQELPVAQDGMARIELDTYQPPSTGGNGTSFFGSEAITKQTWDLTGGGIAFEGTFRFEGNQGGMIAGFFGYQAFPIGQGNPVHDEIDFEILTTQLARISTNVFVQQTVGAALSEPQAPGTLPPGTFGNWHTYTMEWLPGMVSWLLDGQVIRTETTNIPTEPLALHMNLWGVPTSYGVNPGDPTGPTVGDPSFVPAKSPGQNQAYFFDVSSVKVERLSTQTGDGGDNNLVGTANNDGISGLAGNDTISAGAGDDTIIGGAGNDTIDGGPGNDTAVFSGPMSRYDVAVVGSGLTVTDHAPASGPGSDGIDTLTNVEFLNFSDGLYAVGAGGTLTLVPITPSLGSASINELTVSGDAYVAMKGHTLTEGIAAGVLSNDSSGLPMHASLVTGPSHGTLNLADDGTFNYTPNAGFSGVDNFVYQTTDDSGAIGSATDVIDVVPITPGGTLDLASLSAVEQVATMYAGFLGRGADLPGLLYWAEQQLAGSSAPQGTLASLQNVANGFAGSDEAKGNFALLANPTAATDTQIGSFLDGVFHNLFGRSVDAGGQAYWAGEIKQEIAAGQPVGSVVASIINGAQNTATNQDITALMNKALVSLEYVNQQGTLSTTWTPANHDAAVALIGVVTSDPHTTLTGIKQADALVLADAMGLPTN